MSQRTCTMPGCTVPPRGRGLCPAHYRQARKAAAPPCTVPGCERRQAAKGWCMMHYKRDRNGIPFDVPELGHRKAAGCTADGCTRPHHSGGYCTMHYQRTDPNVGQLRRYGCLVDDCDLEHFGSGYCRAHYSRHLRGCLAKPCLSCGVEFTRPLGKSTSYHYCGDCGLTAAAAGAQRRRERLAQNNVGMTDADRAEALAYREVIALDPCVYCGKRSAAVDHIEAVVRGGSDRWDNLAPICKTCNSTKNKRTVLEMMLHRMAA